MSGKRGRDAFSDDELRAALRAASPEPPLAEVDWERLHGRVMTGAKPLLARTKSRQWWDFAAGWASRGIPYTATAAAAVALILALGVLPTGGSPAGGEPLTPVARMTVEDALVVEAGLLLTAGTAEDVLTSAILYYDGEEW